MMTLVFTAFSSICGSFKIAHSIITGLKDISFFRCGTKFISSGLLHQPWIRDDENCGAIGGMNDWEGKLKYSEKPVPVPLWIQQIPRTTSPGQELR
jgi:hypothetical protein